MRLRANGSASTRRRTAVAAALLAVTALAGCDSAVGGSEGGPDTTGASESAAPEPVRLTTSFRDARAVPIDAPLTVGTEGGTLDTVTVTSPDGGIKGTVEGGSS